MPTTASIRLNGVATPNETYSIGSTVNLTNNDDTGVSTWAWTLLSKPAGSTAVIASPSSAATSFVVDKEGSYLVRLVVNDTLPDEDQDTAVARILSEHLELVAHAKDETGEGDPTEGWAKGWRESWLTIDKALGLSDRRTVKYVGANTSGLKLLTVTGTATLANGDVVPTVDILSSGAGSSAVFLWDGGALTTNDVVPVLSKGMTALVTNPDTMVAGDPAYLGAAGALVKTIPSVDKAHLVGFCIAVSGPNVTLWFDPQMRVNNLTVPVATVIDGTALAGTSQQVAHADHAHALATYSGTPTTASSTAGTAGTSGTAPSRGNHSHQVATGTPVAVTPDASPAVGSGPELAMKDHQHGLTTYASNPADLTDATPGAGTSATAPARGDHAHAHGNRGGGTLHAAATPSVNGFLSAADKLKLDGLSPSTQNYASNGAFDLWQRGTSPFTITSGGGIVRAYTADRWHGFVRRDGGGSPSIIVSRQTGAAGSSRYSLRVQKNGAGLTYFAGVAIEIDRRWVEQLRGKKLTIFYKVKNGAGFTGSPLTTVMTNVDTAGVEAEWWGTYASGAEHQAFFHSAPGASFVTRSHTTTSVLPSNLVGLAVLLGVYHDFGIGGGATDNIEFAEVVIVAGDVVPTSFAYAAGSYGGEILHCRQFYEKSYELDTAPGTATQTARWCTAVETGVLIGSGTSYSFGNGGVDFRVTKRATPAISVYDPITPASNAIYLDGGSKLTGATLISTERTLLYNNTGGGITPTTPGVVGHWVADAEI